MIAHIITPISIILPRFANIDENVGVIFERQYGQTSALSGMLIWHCGQERVCSSFENALFKNAAIGMMNTASIIIIPKIADSVDILFLLPVRLAARSLYPGMIYGPMRKLCRFEHYKP